MCARELERNFKPPQIVTIVPDIHIGMADKLGAELLKGTSYDGMIPVSVLDHVALVEKVGMTEEGLAFLKAHDDLETNIRAVSEGPTDEPSDAVVDLPGHDDEPAVDSGREPEASPESVRPVTKKPGKRGRGKS